MNPAVATWGRDRLDIFGLGTNQALYHKGWDGSAWRPSQTGWEDLGGTFQLGGGGLDPKTAVAAWGPNRLDIFSLNESNQHMVHKAWDGSVWRPSQTGWEDLGGVFIGQWWP
jgi:hypothetical protein